MTWLKIDDGFASHPKVIGLTDGAFRLHVNAMGYCARHLTDGELTEAVIPSLYHRNVRKFVAELIEVGLWHDEKHACSSCPIVVRGRYYVHDFLQWNPNAEKVEGERAAARERMQRIRRTHRSPEQTPNVPENDDRSSASRGSPSPSRPVPSITGNSSLQESHDATAGPVDDDEKHLARQVLDRLADVRMDRRTDIRDRDRYRPVVVGELEREHGERLLRLIREHPLAPVDVLAGAIAGEPNSLHLYRAEASA